MSVIYTSTTGEAVNVGSYVVTPTPGLYSETAIDSLDALVGVTLARTNTLATDLLSPALEVIGVVPVIIPNSSTVATNGDLTLTALPAVYSDGAWVYLPAGAVVGGLAGFYWTVFSSTTAGVVKTNYIDPSATEFLPYVPTGALVTAVGSNAAYTTPTSTDIAMVNITLAANSISVGSVLRTISRVTCTNAANGKTVKHLLGSTSIGSRTYTTSTGGTLSTESYNRTRASQVLGTLDGTGGVSTTTYGTVDTTAASKLVIAGSIAADTQYLVLEAFTFRKTTN